MKEENEEIGSDLEQMIAMLEKAEIDYYKDEEEHEHELVTLIINDDSIRMYFNEDGDLVEINS